VNHTTLGIGATLAMAAVLIAGMNFVPTQTAHATFKSIRVGGIVIKIRDSKGASGGCITCQEKHS
jgi:hypothetical protein